MLSAAGALALLLIAGAAAGAESTPAGTVTVAGAQETVFDHATQACEDGDIPDGPARAFRVAGGNIELIAANDVTYRMVGKDFDHLKKDCGAPAMRSDHDPNPADFQDSEWPASPYTLDGRTVYAITHNEYHPWEHKEPPFDDRTNCGLRGPEALDNCWYNVLGFAISRDGGKTFVHPPPPRQLVAMMPYRYQPRMGKTGLFAPSNIFHNPADGFYYLFAAASLENKQASRHACLLRTNNLADPGSWRGWDGSDFSVTFQNPYARTIAAPEQATCAPIPRLGTVRSVTFNSALNAWLAIADGPKNVDGRPVAGFSYSVSPDLQNWSPPKPITGIEIVPGDVYSYPALIDQTDTTPNFERSGQHAYLYFVHWAKPGRWTRDLVRVPVTITRE
jgi:hypothetical protein